MGGGVRNSKDLYLHKYSRWNLRLDNNALPNIRDSLYQTVRLVSVGDIEKQESAKSPRTIYVDR